MKRRYYDSKGKEARHIVWKLWGAVKPGKSPIERWGGVAWEPMGEARIQAHRREGDEVRLLFIEVPKEAVE